jgi:hypothetical protein
MHTKFHNDWISHPDINMGVKQTHTQSMVIAQGYFNFFFLNKGSRLKSNRFILRCLNLIVKISTERPTADKGQYCRVDCAVCRDKNGSE